MKKIIILTLLFLSMFSIVSADLTTNNEAYFSLDDSLVTNNGATYTSSGKINGAYSFDGSNDYMTIPDFDYASGDFSIGLWYYLDSSYSGDNPFIYDHGGTNRIDLFANSNANRKLRWGMSGSSTSFDRTTTEYAEENAWHYLTVTREGNVFTLYKDATQIDTVTSAVGTINPTGDIFLSRYYASGAAYWKGKLDEPSIWSRALTSTEVTELYNSGNGKQAYDLNSQSGLVFSNTLDTDLSGDLTSNGNTLTLYGDTVYTSSGKINGAYSFDGSGDYIKTNDIGTQWNDVSTMSTWIKVDSLSDHRMIYSQYLTDTAHSNGYMRVNTDGHIYISHFGSTSTTITSSATLSTNTWYFITKTFDGSVIKLYINGVLDSTSSAGSGMNSNSLPYDIGRLSSITSQMMDGTMDEFSIWSRVLTSTEITELYNSGSGNQYPYSSTPAPTPIINIVNITANDIEDFNNTYFNTSLLEFYIEVNQSDSNNNINLSYSLDNSAYIDICSNCTNTTNMNTTTKYFSNPEVVINSSNYPIYGDSGFYPYLTQYCVENGFDDYNGYSKSSASYTEFAKWDGSTWFYFNSSPDLKAKISTVRCVKVYNALTLQLLDSIYNITFKATNNETETNSSLYTFTIDTTAPTINIFNTTEITNYNIDWTNHFNYSDTNLDSCWVVVENTTTNCSTYTFTENGEQEVSIYVNDSAGNQINSVYNQTVNPYQYFYFKNNVTSNLISGYNIEYNSISVSTSSTEFKFKYNDLGNGTYPIKFWKFGFYNTTFDIILNSTSNYNLTTNVQPVPITIKMYDITDSSQLTFDVVILNSTDSQSYTSQTNFSKYYFDLPVGDVEIIISATGFDDTKFYYTITPFTALTVVGYLTPSNLTEIYTFSVKEATTEQDLDGVKVEIQKIINGIYTTLVQKKTSGSGLVYFNLDPSQEYKVILSKTGYVSATATTIPQTKEYVVKLQDESTAFEYIDTLSYSFTPINNILNTNVSLLFTGFISDSSFTSTNFTIKYGNGTIIYSDSSLNPTGTTYTYTYTIPATTNQSKIIVSMTYIKDGKTATVSKTYNIVTIDGDSFISVFQDFGADTSEDSVLLRWFVIMMVIVTLLIWGSYIGTTTINLMIVPAILFFTYIGWLSWVFGSVVMFVATILYLGGKN